MVWSVCKNAESETKTCEAHAGASRLEKPILKTKQTKKQKKQQPIICWSKHQVNYLSDKKNLTGGR